MQLWQVVVVVDITVEEAVVAVVLLLDQQH
jgi:hypothetical protein